MTAIHSDHDPTATIIGDTPAIRRLRTLILAIAPESVSVLIEGPTGSGKELVASALHELSGRRGRCVAFNVCAVTETMFEDALYGHVRGAYTGAASDAPGYLLEADRGTVFLDEISGLALPMQAKLLRAIETRTFRPVGARRDYRSDFRVLAATNENLDRLVQAGRFRLDLLHRLGEFVLHVPGLSERADDIPLLARHFLRSIHGSEQPELTADGIEALQQYHWPGNVRELRHVIVRAILLARGRAIGREVIRSVLPQAERSPATELREDFMARRLVEILSQVNGKVPPAATMLGVRRSTVYRRLKRFGITLADLRKRSETSSAVADCRTQSRDTAATPRDGGPDHDRQETMRQ